MQVMLLLFQNVYQTSQELFYNKERIIVSFLLFIILKFI